MLRRTLINLLGGLTRPQVESLVVDILKQENKPPVVLGFRHHEMTAESKEPKMTKLINKKQK